MRNYEAGFRQTLKDCNYCNNAIIKNSDNKYNRVNSAEQKTSVIFKNKLAKQNLRKLKDEENLH